VGVCAPATPRRRVGVTWGGPGGGRGRA